MRWAVVWIDPSDMSLTFNSLFEMPLDGYWHRAAVLITTFNSLFEMPVRPSGSSGG